MTKQTVIGVGAVAKMLGLSRSRVSQLLAEGRLLAEMVGRTPVFSLESIKSFVKRDRDRRRKEFARNRKNSEN